MINNKSLFTLFLIVFLTMMFLVSCTSRQSNGVVVDDSLTVYPSKNNKDISVGISLCRKIDKKTGDYIGEGNQFRIMKNGWLQAFVKVENKDISDLKKWMFHFDWIGPDGKTFYLKQYNLNIEDTTSVINSSVSLSPEARLAGKYKLRLYYFRELIAEKTFELIPQFHADFFDFEKLSSQISFCRKVDKLTGKRNGIDSVFTLKNRRSIRAFFDFYDRSEFGDKELLFRFDWMKADSNAFYRKSIDVAPEDSTTSIFSSISISPQKRDSGDYKLQVYLFNELIAEKDFKIIEEPKVIPIDPKDINANIILYRKISKKTGKRIGEGDEFEQKEKRKVRALVQIRNRSKFKGRDLDFLIEWVGPDGKSFYQKEIIFKATDGGSELNSAISISPGKRNPGKYSFCLLLNNELVEQKDFVLVIE